MIRFADPRYTNLRHHCRELTVLKRGGKCRASSMRSKGISGSACAKVAAVASVGGIGAQSSIIILTPDSSVAAECSISPRELGRFACDASWLYPDYHSSCVIAGGSAASRDYIQRARRELEQRVVRRVELVARPLVVLVAELFKRTGLFRREFQQAPFGAS